MQATSARWLEATRSSREIATSLTVTPHGRLTTPLRFTSGSIRLVGGTGMRATASINVAALNRSAAGAVESTRVESAGWGIGPWGLESWGGVDTGVPGSNGGITGTPRIWPLISGEGALFEVKHGFKYGTASELLPLGVLLAADVPAPLFGSEYQVRLIDQWAALEEAEFTAPFQPTAGSRVAIISAAVAEVLPDVDIIDRSETSGGDHNGVAVWDRSRAQLIRDMARDGRLECFFDGQGRFIIRRDPLLFASPQGDASAFVLTTGAAGTIIEAERRRPLARRYNTVVVRPGSQQTWAQQVVAISDPANPRHRSRIGTRPFFMDAPTATDATAARMVGINALQRLVKPATERRVIALADPSIEPGDVGLLHHVETPTDEGVNETVTVADVEFDLVSGLMDVTLASAGLIDTESL